MKAEETSHSATFHQEFALCRAITTVIQENAVNMMTDNVRLEPYSQFSDKNIIG